MLEVIFFAKFLNQSTIFSLFVGRNVKNIHSLLCCHFSQAALENFIPSVLKSANIYSSQNDLHFPIIQRSGVNQYGKNVYYFFNYSNDSQTLRYDYGKGKELTDNKQISKGTQLNLKAWDFKIVVED